MTQNIFEEYEQRLENGWEVLPIDITAISARLETERALLVKAEEVVSLSKEMEKQHGLAGYVVEFAEQTVSELLTECTFGQQILTQAEQTLEGRGLYMAEGNLRGADLSGATLLGTTQVRAYLDGEQT